MPSVIYVEKINELPKIIRNALKINVDINDVDRYLTFYHENTFSFDWDGFGTKLQKHFYLSGNLVDIDISDDQMLEFIQKNNKELEILISEYLKKIQYG